MIRDRLSELVREEIAPGGRAADGDALPEDFTVTYIVGAFMAVMEWWIKQGMAIPPQRIDALLQRAVAEGVAAASRF